MTRGERLGLTDGDYRLHSSLDYINRAQTDPGFGPPDNVYGQLQQLMLYTSLAVPGFAMEDDLESVRRYAEMGVRAGLEYFFGDWRNVPQRTIPVDAVGADELRKKLLYISDFLRIVRMCGVISDWEAARRLAEYPDREECRRPDGDCEEENCYVFALCRFLLGEFHIERNDNEIKGILSRRSKRYKLLAALMLDVSSRDTESFNQHLNEYLKFYKNREFRKNIPQMVCYDGTFWINCARHVGMSPEWDSRFDDYLILLERDRPDR